MSVFDLKGRIPPGERLAPGHVACPGCGATIAMRLVLKAVGPASVVTAPGCRWTDRTGPEPRTALEVPHLRAAAGAVAAEAAGLRATLDARGDRETIVLAWADTTEAFDSGLQALSAAAERNEDILYVCHDSGGGVGAAIPCVPGAPRGTWTVAAPGAADGPHARKDLVGILAAHHIPYAATATVAHPVDLMEKVRKARSIPGTRFLHVYGPCPPGCMIPSDQTIDLARQAVRTRLFPLYEVEKGRRWRLTADHPGDPVEPFYRRQGRFGRLAPEQFRRFQAEVDARWEVLRKRVESGS